MARARLRFYAELNDFLSPPLRQGDVEHEFIGRPTVKDAIESKGVPHSEVHLVVINGSPADLGTGISDGDRISVYPTFTGIDTADVPSARRARRGATRFVADVHLGKLARRLRLLGFDTVWEPDASDAQLARVSSDEGRVLLTRDRGLLKRREVEQGFYVRDDEAIEQAVDVVVHLGIVHAIEPFGRCTVCNGPLQRVERSDVEDSLPPRTRRDFSAFRRCASCERVYWEGSHHSRLERVVDEIRARAASATTAAR